jgi:hypothetical protein
LLEQDRKNFDWRVKAKRLRSSPSLYTGDSDAWLYTVSVNGREGLVLSESQNIAQNIPRIGWKDQSAAISSLPTKYRHDEL